MLQLHVCKLYTANPLAMFFFSICQKLCNTAVGCSWLCKVCQVWKVMWCQGSCASSPAVQVLEWTAHTHQRFTGMVCWSHSALLAIKLSRSQSAWPHHKRYLLFKKIASVIQLFCERRSRIDTLVLCGFRIMTLCCFEFLCDKFTVHSFQYPTIPHLLQLYNMMQDLRGRMQRSVMQDVGFSPVRVFWSSWPLWSTSVALWCAVDFCDTSSTVGARGSIFDGKYQPTLWFWGFWGSLAPHLVGKYMKISVFLRLHS